MQFIINRFEESFQKQNICTEMRKIFWQLKKHDYLRANSRMALCLPTLTYNGALGYQQLVMSLFATLPWLAIDRWSDWSGAARPYPAARPRSHVHPNTWPIVARYRPMSSSTKPRLFIHGFILTNNSLDRHATATQYRLIDTHHPLQYNIVYLK